MARRTGGQVVAKLAAVIELHETRLVGALYARVPPTVLWLLVIGLNLSLGLVGYNAGLSRKRSPVIAFTLAISLGAVLWLVVDLDRPQDGQINVSQRPLMDLQERLDATDR